MATTTPPLSLGEILDRSVQLYRRNFLLFMGIAMLPSAFDVLISGGLGIFFTSRAPALQTSANGEVLALFLLVLALFFLIGLPLLMAGISLGLSALTHAAFLQNRGESPTVRSSYAYAFKHFWRYLGVLGFQFLFAAIIPGAAFSGIFFIGAMATALVATTGAGKPIAFVFGLVLLLLGLAAVVVAVWIWLRYSLAFPVCITEQRKAWPCMQRSSQLSKGSLGRIFVMYLLVFILVFIAYYALTIPVNLILKYTIYKSIAGMAIFTHPPLPLQVINLFISLLERSFAMPIQAIALLFFYNDQRTRKEGYDIELLMDQAGWTNLYVPQPAAAQPSHAMAQTEASPIEAAALPVPIPESATSPPNEPDQNISTSSSHPEVSGA